jgi:predicted nucleotidyltransferase
MKRPMSIDQLVDLLQNLFTSHEEVLLAYLYGSFVNGPWTSRSDIDVGLYVTDEANKNPWYQLRIQEELNENSGLTPKFDVHILNGAGPKFCYEVIFRTPKIVVRDESLRVEFETRTLIEWYDMRPTFEQYRRELAEVMRN